MLMQVVKALMAGIFSLAIVLILNTKLGKLPPLGKFFDPFGGFWQNAEPAGNADTATLQLAGLKGKVSLVFDDRMIPHIFAENEEDLYFAQGYITAKDRLWQMDVQTRLASGRLSEVLGPDLLETDRFQRRMGMTYGAEKMIGEVKRHPQLRRVLEAYARGVNAWIGSLSPKDYPIEFKILDYAPEEWKILNSALLLKMMSSTLAGGSDEFYMNNVLQKFGPEGTRDLFPDYPFQSDPIIPRGTAWEGRRVPVPQVPADYQVAEGVSQVRTRQKVEGIGSNNWAVSGAKTLSGLPILANDPHLDLTLPAIWYLLQLSAPGVNVNGVSIPGAPCVIIGYNQKVAWGVTNVGSDVLDWYRVRFNGAARSAYWYEGKWRPLKLRIEHIRVRGGETIDDTVRYTHHGPVVYEDRQRPPLFKPYVPEGHALRWIAHDPSADIETFYLLNRAANYDDYRKALAWYTAPAQNFAFADIDNDIAITPNGKFPLKWKEQGKFLLDGSRKDNDWQGFIPRDQNPTVKNPPRGFISSANQVSADQTYPYYLNWEFGAYERGHRINQRLAIMKNATADSLRDLQNDTYSVLAETILPLLLSQVDRATLNASQLAAFKAVSSWNRQYRAHEIGASLFELWQVRLQNLIWDEFVDAKRPMRQPSRDRAVELLLHAPESKWYDNVSTPVKETRGMLIRQAFVFAADSLQRKYGPLGKKWEWGNLKQSHVPHLAGFPGFGSADLDIGGSKSVVNALSNKNGPSWRMVVALGKPTKGYGIFPGGESGNPGSPYYDDMIGTWANGKLDELVFLNSADEKNPRIKKKLVLVMK